MRWKKTVIWWTFLSVHSNSLRRLLREDRTCVPGKKWRVLSEDRTFHCVDRETVQSVSCYSLSFILKRLHPSGSPIPNSSHLSVRQPTPVYPIAEVLQHNRSGHNILPCLFFRWGSPIPNPSHLSVGRRTPASIVAVEWVSWTRVDTICRCRGRRDETRSLPSPQT